MLRSYICSFLFAFATCAAAQTLIPQSSHTFRITGIVVNAITAEPVSKIEVTIGSALRPDALETELTIEDGHFDFENLKPGKYWLQAHGRGYAPQRFDQHEDFSTAIAVGSNVQSEGLIFRLHPEATILGSITDEQNEPVPEAQVMLFHIGVENGAATTQLRAQVMTDDQGHYRLSHVPSGNYYLAASGRPWYAEHHHRVLVVGRNQIGDRLPRETEPDPEFDVTYPITFYAGVTDPAAATLFTVKPTDRLVADFTLNAVPSLHLHIADFGIDPRQGINANLSENLFGVTVPVRSEISMAHPGDLEISGVAPGQYSLNLQSYGKTPLSRQKEIDVSGNSEINMAESSGSPSITGTVQFDNGQPPPRQAAVMLMARFQQNLAAQTSAGGEFEITPDRARIGKYSVGVFGIPGAFVKSVSATGARVTGRELEVSGNAPIRLKIVLAQGVGRVDGTALRDGKPFAGAMIVLVPPDIQHNLILVRRDQSDSDGTFSLYNVVPGSYTVLAIQNGWDLQWLSPDVLQPYLKAGTTVNVTARGKYDPGRYDIKVIVQ